jgi:hypothetical protein
MQLGHRSLILSVLTLLLTSGCDFTSPWGTSTTGSDYGANSVVGNTGGTGTGMGGGSTVKPGVGGESGISGSNNFVVESTSVEGVVSVVTGASQTVSITFTSNDGLAITGFGVSGTLGTLPAGWSGPGTFTCALVSAGSGCVLNLTYSPTALDSGTLTVNYIYVDNANIPKAPGGSFTISYAAIAQNNVIAQATPTGQINAIVGRGNQSVSVNFITDDGNAATNLALTTDLTALPAGWSTTATALSCAIVSSGNGCQLALTYAPTSAARGTLTLNYSYTDDSGAPRTAALNIPYSTTSSNNVIAAASPAGEVEAIEKTGGQAVAVTFTTDDGGGATNLALASNLAALPPGWTSASKTFSCAGLGTGNGCQLRLTYAPTALATGTLILNYTYDNDAGTAESGSLNVAYKATTNDNVVGTAAPSGQINAVVGMGTQAVSVTFTTDDARPATALQLTSSLTTLPAGWSTTATALACTEVTTGNGCQIDLTYAPLAAGVGTLALNYSYINNDGVLKTGTVNVPYRATTNDNVAGTPSPTGQINAVAASGSQVVTVTFTTDDGNPASGLSVTSGLASLPAGWSSSAGSFACSTLSNGNSCQLTLMYAPAAADAGTLALNYAYLNDAGIAKTGSVNVPYLATTNDNVVGTASPSGQINAVSGAGSQNVVVTFTTDDSNLASGLSVTSGLASLPAGWSSPSSSFTCASVSVGTACQLTLSYAPSVAGIGILTFGFSYTNDSGTVKTGTVTVHYTAS